MGETIETAALLVKMGFKRLFGAFSQSEYDATVAYIIGYEDGMLGRACDPEKAIDMRFAVKKKFQKWRR